MWGRLPAGAHRAAMPANRPRVRPSTVPSAGSSIHGATPASVRPSASRCVTARRSGPPSTAMLRFSVPAARCDRTGSAMRVRRATQACRTSTPSGRGSSAGLARRRVDLTRIGAVRHSLPTLDRQRMPASAARFKTSRRRMAFSGPTPPVRWLARAARRSTRRARAPRRRSAPIRAGPRPRQLSPGAVQPVERVLVHHEPLGELVQADVVLARSSTPGGGGRSRRPLRARSASPDRDTGDRRPCTAPTRTPGSHRVGRTPWLCISAYSMAVRLKLPSPYQCSMWPSGRCMPSITADLRVDPGERPPGQARGSPGRSHSRLCRRSRRTNRAAGRPRTGRGSHTWLR